MRRLAHISLWVSGLLLLGHLFTPHCHEHTDADTVCPLKSQSFHSLAEALSALFDPDLGADHLEDFQTASVHWALPCTDPAVRIDPIESAPAPLLICRKACDAISPYPSLRAPPVDC